MISTSQWIRREGHWLAGDRGGDGVMGDVFLEGNDILGGKKVSSNKMGALRKYLVSQIKRCALRRGEPLEFPLIIN